MSLPNSGIDTVVLASGINKVPLYEGYEAGYKALLPVCGRASIHYSLDALDGVPEVGRICVEGPTALLEPELAARADRSRIEPIAGGETFLDSLVIGLKHFPDSKQVLFVTADLPLISPEAIGDFLEGCAAHPAERPCLYVSAVPCLSVLIDNEGVFFNCKNCGWKGGKSYDSQSKGRSVVRSSGDLSGSRRTYGHLQRQARSSWRREGG